MIGDFGQRNVDGCQQVNAVEPRTITAGVGCVQSLRDHVSRDRQLRRRGLFLNVSPLFFGCVNTPWLRRRGSRLSICHSLYSLLWTRPRGLAVRAQHLALGVKQASQKTALSTVLIDLRVWITTAFTGLGVGGKPNIVREIPSRY